MTNDEARELMRSVLRLIAPEADLDSVVEGETIQEALELDSIDFLQFVTGLAEATGLEMPERDYPQLSTVEGCVTYLTSTH
jgi:acyl carrier protein